MRSFLIVMMLVFLSGGAISGEASGPKMARPRTAAPLMVRQQTPPPKTAPASPSDDTASYFFLLGRHLESEGKIDEAIAAHKRAIALMPESAELQAELAGLYARQDRNREAVDTAEAALQRNPTNREANRVLGSILAALSQSPKPLRPGDDPSQYPARAIAALEKARRDAGFDVNIELMLGRLYLQSGNATNAVASLRRVVEDQPGYPEAAMLLAAAQSDGGRPNDAITTLEATLEENPTFFRGRIRLAQLYDEQHRYKEAAATYAKAQAANPRVDLSTPRAAALINAGDPAAARTLLETSVKRPSATPDAAALYLLGQAQRQVKDFAAATETIERLKTAFPNDRRALYLGAKLLDDKGQRSEAITAFEALIKQSPEDSSLVYEYANLLEKGGRIAEAERALRGLLSRDPVDANALNALGYMFAERGERLDEAIVLLQRALKVEPANPSFLDSLGWAYFQQGRTDLADAPLTEAAAKLPSSSAVQDHLGDLRFKQQRYADAAAAWERSLASDGEAIDRAKVAQKLRDVRARIFKRPGPESEWEPSAAAEREGAKRQALGVGPQRHQAKWGPTSSEKSACGCGERAERVEAPRVGVGPHEQ
jgi:tetratricopeptide (TPR) repeat protein